MSLKEQIEKHAEDFTYIDSETSAIVVDVAFVFTAYFWNGHQHAVRLAVAECFNQFEEVFEHPFKWGFDNDVGKFKDIKKITDINQYITSMDEDDTLCYYLSSAENRESVGDYVISCLTERAWMKNNISVLKFNVPRSVICEPKKYIALKELMASFLEKLNPYHANAGFSSVSTYEETIWDGGKYDLATRYMTVVADDFASDVIKAPFGIKSVNWLNYISKKLALCIDDLGNISAYFAKENFSAIEAKHGFLIYASDTPQIVHIDEPLPEKYVKLNALLRPLRIGMFGSMGSMSINGEIRFDEYTTDLWIRRLDGRGIWPPDSDVGIPSELPIVKPKSSKYLKSHDKCQISGRYRDSSIPWPDDPGDYDAAHFVVLLPNDIAPYQLRLGPHGELLERVMVKWEYIQG